MLRNINIFLRTTSVIFLLICFLPLAGIFADGVDVEYQTHVQNIGWQDSVINGMTAGTTGVGLRLEGLCITLKNQDPQNLRVIYRAHVQDVGWQDWVSDYALSGTVGEGKRLEAIEIRLEGSESQNYDIYYRTHVQDLGWLAWAKNGEDSGSSGLSRRLEALEIKVLPKSEAAPFSPDSRERAYYTVDTMGFIHYKAQIPQEGWLKYSFDGQETGTTGLSISADALSVGLTDGLLQDVTSGIQYQAHLHNYGWTDWVGNNDIVGKGSPENPIQAVRIRLTGAVEGAYDIYYRSHIANYGWLDWTKNGKKSGSEGLGLGLEAVQICLVAKGDNPPGKTTKPYISNKVTWTYPLEKYTELSSEYGPRWGSFHYGIDFPAPTGTPIRAAAAGKVYFTGGEDNGQSYGFNVRIENNSGERVIYAHMSKIAAHIGQTVKAGDVIGYVGQTGNATGPHLHLEVATPPKYETVDPIQYFIIDD